jgi:hypothetical protein
MSAADTRVAAMNSRFIIAVLFAFACSGCIFTPATNVPLRSAMVGEDDNAVLKVGRADRALVLSVLGTPSLTTVDGRAVGYLFATLEGTQSGLMLGPCSQLGFGTTEVYGNDDVWLAFDRSGVLCLAKKRLIRGGNSQRAWETFKRTSTCLEVPQ